MARTAKGNEPVAPATGLFIKRPTAPEEAAARRGFRRPFRSAFVLSGIPVAGATG